MPVEWDPRKAAANLAKHGLRFADGIVVLSDPLAVTVEDLGAQEEDRFVTIGMDGQGRILVVTYTWRVDAARLITARRATRRERKQYEGDA